MKISSLRSPFAVSLILGIAVVSSLILALASSAQTRPDKPAAVKSKAAAKRARAKRTPPSVSRPTLAPSVTAQRPAATSAAIRPPERPEAYDSPAEAAEFFRLKRLPAGANHLPIEKYFEAQEQMRLMPQYSTATARHLPPRAAMNKQELESLPAWTPLGPNNVGGRTRALVIHPANPSVMYAASVSGGVWKTTNGGQSWTPLADLIANIAVSALAMDPKNPNVIYAGTGEGYFNVDLVRGAGIFKTTDGGATWTRLASTNVEDFYFVNDIVISPASSQRLYAATSTGVFRSGDGGITWTRTLNPTKSSNTTVLGGCLDLAMRTDKASDYLFAACGTILDQGTVYRNTDAANSGVWTPVLSESGMGRTSLALAPSDQSVIYAATASITENDYLDGLHAVFRSTSSGDPGSWTSRVRGADVTKLNTLLLSNPWAAFQTQCGFGTRDVIASQGWYDNVIAVDPANPNTVFVGGVDLFRSDDGGRNWGLASYWWADGTVGARAAQYAHADQHAIVFHPQYNGTSNQTLFVANDGGIFRTDNARATTGSSYNSPCNPASSAITWTSINQGYATVQFYHGAVYPDGKTYFGGAQDNGTLQGNDASGAGDWKSILGGDGGYVAIDFTNPNILYASNPGRIIQKSLDGGATFLPATDGISDGALFISPLVMDPSDPLRLWTGGQYVWRSDNGAVSWAKASSGVTSTRISALAVAPTDANRVLAGAISGRIARTINGLTSTESTVWTFHQTVRGISGAWVSWLTFDPANANIAYATITTFGGPHVFKSTDGGQSWNAIDGTGVTGLPDIPVHCLVVDSSNTARLYIGTDLGVFVTTDGGQNWAVENTGFANVATEALVLNPVNGVNTLYAFTHGRGVWRVTPGTSGCRVTLSSVEQTFSGNGGTGSVAVTTDPGSCVWTAQSNAEWITINSGASGTGNSTINFTVAINNTTADRTGTVTIVGSTFTITQRRCNCTITPDKASFPASGGTGSATVTAPTGALWQSSSDVTWIAFNSGSNGNGNGNVTFTVAANTGNSTRFGTLTIAGQTLSVGQFGSASSCAASAIAFGATTNGELKADDCYSTVRYYSSAQYYADRYSFTGTTGQPIAIALTTTGLSPFVSLIGPGGNVVAENSSGSNSLRIPPTSGFLNLPTTGTYVIEVTALYSGGTGSYALNLSTIPAGCSYVLSTNSQAFSDTGGTGTILLTAGSGCNWQAITNAMWLTLNASSGTGNGTIGYSVAINYTPEARTGTLNISGQVFTVTQAARSCPPIPIRLGQIVSGYRGDAGDCRNDYSYGIYYYDRYTFSGAAGQTVSLIYSESPSSLGLYGPDGAYISQNPGGTYTLPTSGNYLIYLSGYYGTGTYTLSLLGLTTGCKYSLAATDLTVNAAGGTRSVNLNTSSGCDWQATSPANWITLNNSSGRGGGAVGFTIVPNTSVNGREGYIYIAGQGLRVSQSGVVNNCSVTPIRPGQTVTGKIDYSDCYSNGYYAERYSFEAIAGQKLDIVPQIYFSYGGITLIAPNGEPLTFGYYGRVSATLPTTGTYLLHVYYDGIFNYTFGLGLTSPGCNYQLSSSSASFTNSGGLGSVNLVTSGNCSWNALSSQSWLAINSAISGSGSSIVSFSVAPYDNAYSPRSAQIVIGGQTFTITQFQSGCPKPLTPSQWVNADLDGCNRFTFSGTAGQSVALTVVGDNFRPKVFLQDPNGLTLFDEPNLLDNATVNIPSVSLPISGIYTVGVYINYGLIGGKYRVRMTNVGSAGCSYSAVISNQNFGAASGAGSLNINAETSCAWQAQSDVSWITFNSNSNGRGAGTVNFTVAPNTSNSPRSGTLIVGGQTFSVSQIGDGSSCTVTPINFGQTVNGNWSDGDCKAPTGSYPYADRYSFTGTAGQAVRISLSSNDYSKALYLIGPNGIVIAQDSYSNVLYVPRYYTGSYISLPSSGTYLIEVTGYSGNSYILTLSTTSSCIYSLTPANQSFGADSGAGVGSVATGSNCIWIANSNTPWISLTSVSSTPGNGTVNYSVAPNLGANSRTGTINIAGQTLTVTQAGRPCSSATPINAGQSVTGSLSTSDCASSVIADLAYRADRYSFTGAAGQLVALSLNSAAFDPYLYLIGPDGAVLAEDDDGGNALNARIPARSGFFKLPASGVYTIEVTSFAALSTGDYTLRLSVTTCNYAVAPLQPPHYEAAGGSGSVTVNCADGCEWAAASQVSWITLTAGASGTGTGSVTFNVAPNTSAQARSGTLSVAGQTVTITQTAAVASVSAASFGGAELASESIVAAFGAGLATATQVAATVPLPTTLAGTTVKVRDSAGFERDAPLFFVAPTQVNYLIPVGTAAGAATVTISSGDSKVSTGVVQISAVAPGLFSANTSGTGLAAATVLRVKADGSQSYEPVTRFDSAQGKIVAVPIDLGPETDQVFLLAFGTGFHKPSALSAVSCKIGGTNTEVLYAGPQGDFVGLDQANVRIPRGLKGRGEVDVVLTVDTKLANTVKVNIK